LKNVLTSVFLVSFFVSFGAFGAIKALIVDGQNNHEWARTTPELRKILLDTGLFEVDVATSPASGGDLSKFSPKFKKYDVVVLNYNGDLWNKSTQNAFVKFVKNGGGVAVVHAANNPFGKWEEYNEIIGFGGWGNRNKSSGPYIHWVDGKLVYDHDSDGPGGAHEGYAEFIVTSRDLNHPIMKGMPKQWFQNDELYNYMRGPGKNMHVLATAHSKRPKDKGGSGKHEPMLFTVEYGKGSVFHTTLGHNVRSMRDKGFIGTFARGTEWAATGQVTIPLPDDVPALLEPYKALTRFDGKNSVVTLVEVVTQIGQASNDPAKWSEIEGALIEAMQDRNADFLARQAACNTLGLMNSTLAIRGMTALLGESKPLSDAARLGLQRITHEAAGDALISGLDFADTGNRVGILVSLGARGEDNGVDALADFARSSDKAESGAALKSLGQVGSTRALKSLRALERNDRLLLGALNTCAFGLLENGEAGLAASVFQSVLDSPEATPPMRNAALNGYIAAAPDEGMEKVWESLADPKTSGAARTTLGALPVEEGIVRAIAKRVGDLPEQQQIDVLPLLASMGHEAALQDVFDIAKNGASAELKDAAIVALGSIPGDAESVSYLATIATDPNSVAAATLVRSPGQKVDDAIVSGIKNSKDRLRSTYIDVATKRRLTAASSPLLALAVKKKIDTRTEALEALTVLGRESDYEALLKLPEELPTALLALGAEVVRNAGRYVKDAKRRELLYLEALAFYPPESKGALIPGLADIPSKTTLKRTIRFGESLHPDVRRGAFEALANWPTADSIRPLLDLAENPDLKNEQSVIMESFAKAMKNAPDSAIDLKLEQSKRAIEIGLELNEKRVLISVIRGLLDVRSLELLATLATDPKLEQEARAAMPAIKVALMEKPGLSSSHNSRDLARMQDGKPGSRWSTGTPMKGGEWIMINLRMPSKVSGVTLDSTRSSGDYPRGYEMYISSVSDDRGALVAKGKGSKPVTEIKLGDPVEGQYITIVQTGTVNGLYWSIHELTVDHLPEFPEE